MIRPATVENRRQLALQWVSSNTELNQLISPDLQARNVLQRIRSKLTARRTSAQIRELRRDIFFIREQMERRCLGSNPHTWGVLSGGEFHRGRRSLSSFRLENTLGALGLSFTSNPNLQSQIDFLRNSLPAARVKAELGHQNAVTEIEQQTLRLLETGELSHKQRQSLIEHLPAELRPIPATLDHLTRQIPPVTLYITLRGPDVPYHYAETRRIELNDIVVDSGLQGRGLGTAVLGQLNAYADQHGLPIEGKLEPGPGKPAEDVIFTAKWYAKMGFTQGSLEPSEWARGGRIRRLPQPMSNEWTRTD